MTINAPREAIPDVVRRLVENAIDVYEVAVERQTLEAYFLDVTGGSAPENHMPTRSASQAKTRKISAGPWWPRIFTQFLVDVSRKPPRTAQPKPKNISCACHCVEEKGVDGAAMVPVKISAQITGRLNPARHARLKKGRNPTSQSGFAERFIRVSGGCFV